ncbi:hypothetical protein [Pannonibacter carbonis]|uniref:hypothetical protein n=1 Tax=Pannonibacter carbonis TaxID=2067569 RepID=UPI000D0F1ECA|nr:hypothetical protein [Pannonibacter carbonis]
MTGFPDTTGTFSGPSRLTRLLLRITTASRAPVTKSLDPLERALHAACDGGAVSRQASPRNFLLWYPVLRRHRWPGIILLPNADAGLSQLEVAIVTRHMLQIAGIDSQTEAVLAPSSPAQEALQQALSRIRAHL